MPVKVEPIECPIEFTANDVIVSSHAFDRYQQRVPESKQHKTVERILQTVLQGRRSDRNPELKLELAPWLVHFKELKEDGRRVVLFRRDASPLVCLAAAARHPSATENQVVVLTCFWADRRIDHSLSNKEMKALNHLQQAVASLPEYFSLQLDEGVLSVFKGRDRVRELQLNVPDVDLDGGDEPPAKQVTPRTLINQKLSPISPRPR